MPAEYIIIRLCHKVVVIYSRLLQLNIGAVSDNTVCETIYTTASFQVTKTKTKTKKS